VPADAAGVSWGGPWDGLGMRGNSSRTMRLDGVRLAPELILGEEGDQIWYVFRVIAPFFLVAMAGTYLGIATAAVEEARSHLARRRVAQAGRGLAELAVIQTQFGALWTRVERARALVSLAALAGDAADPAADSAIMAAKVEAAEAAVDVANAAMSLVGGIGYRENSTLHRLLRDARAGHVMSPTTNLLRLWIGRMQLGQPILGD
jgi:alkylation response protein AidB-like acyl-CoA dehydrogenase